MTRKVAGQQAEMPEQRWRVGGGTAEGKASARQACPARAGASGDGSMDLMEEVLRRANLMAAHQRVVRNGGAPGVDGLKVEELLDYCREHWPRYREELLSGRYQPQPVRRV